MTRSAVYTKVSMYAAKNVHVRPQKYPYFSLYAYSKHLNVRTEKAVSRKNSFCHDKDLISTNTRLAAVRVSNKYLKSLGVSVQ